MNNEDKLTYAVVGFGLVVWLVFIVAVTDLL
jgi:hypothetical protein